MGYVEAAPSASLRSLVQCYWAISGPADAHRVLPDGCIDIVALPSGAIVVGTMTRAFVADAHARTVVGVRFRPGEAARILREAPRDLTDGNAPLAAVWGGAGRLLEDELASSIDQDATFDRYAHLFDDVLARRLVTHADTADLRVRAAAELLASGSSVRAAAERVALSERQLMRRFSDRVGVSPKVFARVMRLQRATRALAAGASPRMAAFDAGYADQAHFTRDARDLALATPGVLVREFAPSDSFKTASALAS